MRSNWLVSLVLGLTLGGCVLPGGSPGEKANVDEVLATIDTAARSGLGHLVRDFLATQQARQQVNVTNDSLLSKNPQDLLSNNSGSLTKNAPLISNNAGGLLASGGSTYRVAALVERPGNPLEVPLGMGMYFFQFMNTEATHVETFLTRAKNQASTGFAVDDGDVLVHSEMTVTLPDWTDIPGLLDGGTTRYAIKVHKSPVLENYESEVRITTPSLGASSDRYVEQATYAIAGVPVTVTSTHSAFAPFTVDGKTVDLPTSGEERLAIGSSVVDLHYDKQGEFGVGTGSWTTPAGATHPLTYTYDFGKNLAEMRVTLPEGRTLILVLKPGLQIESGRIVAAAGETLATVVKRSNGTIALRFADGTETTLFE